MSLASAAAVSGTQTKRPMSIMGDGGFWHNGLLTGVASALFNKDDSVLVIMNNGYSSATGTQDIVSSAAHDGRGAGVEIETAIEERCRLGVTWVRRVRTYGVGKMLATLREATQGAEKGLKVIIADGECQLARQRRIRPLLAKAVGAGKRVARHALLRRAHGLHRRSFLHPHVGLSVADADAQRGSAAHHPIAQVNNDCVGCGLCGESRTPRTLPVLLADRRDRRIRRAGPLARGYAPRRVSRAGSTG